jgi:hypothetical protein
MRKSSADVDQDRERAELRERLKAEGSDPVGTTPEHVRDIFARRSRPNGPKSSSSQA